MILAVCVKSAVEHRWAN